MKNGRRNLRNRRCLEIIAQACLAVAAGLGNLAADDKPVQYVVIDKACQTLTAYEGGRPVLHSRVSTGRYDRSTPNGSFRAGDKFRMHFSRLYHHAPMPYSVQVSGNVFIHGFTVVPAWPASHGCIRVPLDGDNPARRFFEWIESGTRIDIVGHWKGRPSPATKKQLASRPISDEPNKGRGAGRLYAEYE